MAADIRRGIFCCSSMDMLLSCGEEFNDKYEKVESSYAEQKARVAMKRNNCLGYKIVEISSVLSFAEFLVCSWAHDKYN